MPVIQNRQPERQHRSFRLCEEGGTVLQTNKQEVSGLLPLLGKREVWDEFLSYKKEKQHLYVMSTQNM